MNYWKRSKNIKAKYLMVNDYMVGRVSDKI